MSTDKADIGELSTDNADIGELSTDYADIGELSTDNVTEVTKDFHHEVLILSLLYIMFMLFRMCYRIFITIQVNLGYRYIRSIDQFCQALLICR